jgi:hypothetical protein
MTPKRRTRAPESTSEPSLPRARRQAGLAPSFETQLPTASEGSSEPSLPRARRQAGLARSFETQPPTAAEGSSELTAPPATPRRQHQRSPSAEGGEERASSPAHDKFHAELEPGPARKTTSLCWKYFEQKVLGQRRTKTGAMVAEIAGVCQLCLKMGKR